jgi:predicted nucleotidyltransferase component of viral defense system
LTREVPVNVAASVRQRLLNVAHASGVLFQDVLVRFGAERLLYRLSTSPHAPRFVLKGATLFTLWGGAPHRRTKDADLLSTVALSLDEAERIARDLAGLDTQQQDGLIFAPDSVRVREIREEGEHGGVRVNLTADLDGAAVLVQVDIAWGDAVVPAPTTIELPVILPLPAPRLMACPREVLIAEKFEALVKLGVATSRLKDYYDVWFLLTRHTVPRERLVRAVAATFNRRGTAIPAEMPAALLDEFAREPRRVTAWDAFLRRAGVSAGARPALAEVVTAIRPVLMSTAEAARSGHNA